MKKLLLLIPLILVLTGCTNYSNVADYSVAMQNVRKNTPSYSVEVAVKASNGQAKYYKSYMKGDKWRVYESADNGKTFITNNSMLYDGNHVYNYSKDKNIAVIMDFNNVFAKMYSSSEAKEMMGLMTKFMNPVYLLFDWHLDMNNPKVSNCRMWQFDGIGFKNNHFCRKIKYNNMLDICVSDKYGISVYSKIQSQKQGGEVEFNVKKIDTSSYISGSEFELPVGTGVQSLSDMFSQLQGMFGKMGR